MTKTIGWGVIGCGMMGQEHLRNIALLQGAEVVAIYEPDAEMRERSRIIAPQAEFVSSIDALLAIQGIDCLLIASPNHCHVEQLEAIARTRPLPILCEKPLFTKPDDYVRIEALQNTYPFPIWVAMEYRYMPPVAKLSELVQEVTGGIKMLTIREHRFPFLEKVGHWNRFNENSGGTFVEKCCHFFDLMRLLIGSDPIRIMASGGQDVNHLDEVYDGRHSDILDNGYVIVDFKNGVRAMLELCMFAEGAKFQEEISAVGPTGKIEAFVPGPGRFWPKDLGDPPVPQVILSPRNPKGPELLEVAVDENLLEAGDHNGSTFYQHLKFMETVRNGATPEVSLRDGAWAVRMGLAAQQSIQTGQAVTL